MILALIVGSASAAWEIEDKDAPYSSDNYTGSKPAHQVVRLLNNSDEPVGPDQLDGKGDFEFNTSDGTRTSMTYLNSGYWYADFNRGGDFRVTYELIPSDPEESVIRKTESINEGNLTVEYVSGLDGPFKAGEQTTVEYQVLDESGNTMDNLNVELFFAGDPTSSSVELGYNPSLDSYTNVVEVPDYYESDFSAQVIAENNSLSLLRPSGFSSKVFETFPNSTGEVHEIEAGNGCSSESFPEACERGANISTTFNVTQFSASEASLNIIYTYRNGTEQLNQTIDMFKQNGLWNASFQFPDLDSSVYKPRVTMEYNLTIEGSKFITRKSIESRYFDISDRSNPTTYQGESYEIEIATVRPFLLKPLNISRIEKGNVTVYYPDGSQFKFLELSDFSYNSEQGVWETTISLPVDAPTGDYRSDIMMENLYGMAKKKESGFEVDSRDATFSVKPKTLEDSYENLGTYRGNFTFTSRSGDPITINFSTTGDIDASDVNSGEDISLESSEQKNVTLELDIDDFENQTGDIVFEDFDNRFNKTVSVNVEPPSCPVLNGTLCLDRKWINYTSNSVASNVEPLQVDYRGPDEDAFIDTLVSSELSGLVSLNESSFTVKDNKTIGVNFTPEEKGVFTGGVTFFDSEERASVNIKYTVNQEILRPGMNVPSFIDLGTVPRDASLTREIQVNNTGEVEITSLSVSSTSYDISTGDPVSIPTGSVRTVNLTFKQVNTDSGTLEITGNTEKGDITKTVSVSASLEQGYEERISELDSRLQDLMSRAESSQVKSTLNNLELELESTRTQYRQENFDQVETNLQEISNGLDSAEQRIIENQRQPTDPGSNASAGTTEPGEQRPGGGSPGSDEQVEPPQSDGGVLVPLFIVVVVLAVIGFVFATSYVPEEGDPLYDLLGEE